MNLSREHLGRLIANAPDPDAAVFDVLTYLGLRRVLSRPMVLSLLREGESALIPGDRTTNMHRAREVARRQMDNPGAKWMTRTTTRGIRVTRTA